MSHIECNGDLKIIQCERCQKYFNISEVNKEVNNIGDSINIDYLKSFCTEEAIDNMLLYKDMVKQLKSTLKIPIEKEKAK